MKKLFSVILFLSVFLSASEDPKQAYIDTYSSIAVEEMHRSGIPASITLAQGILESRSGLSDLAKDGKNHFGIKCHNDWVGRKMYVDDDRKGECFRVYAKVEDSFRDHSDFIRFRDRYKDLFELDPADYKGWAKGLRKDGYATDPAYPSKLIRIIEDYKLYSYDREVPREEIPQTPMEVEKDSVIVPEGYSETCSISLSREVQLRNGVPYIVAVEGDTYASIAEENNLWRTELLNFNDLGKTDENLSPGTVVFLRVKKNRAARGLDKYVVGEETITLHQISQRFAVRQRSLARLNKVSFNARFKEGDIVKLR